MEIYTIGFTKKTAAQFFDTIKEAGIKRVIDVRLNNSSQLAAFTKKDDLAYFLGGLGGIDYTHIPALAPTKDLLDGYKKQKGSWTIYQDHFIKLMKERKIQETLDRSLFTVPVVLLCSEASAECCHRRLVAEYLRDHWGNVSITHL